MFCVFHIFSQQNVLKERNQLSLDLKQSEEDLSEVQAQHNPKRDQAVAVAIQEAEASNEDLTRNLQITIQEKVEIEKQLEEELSKYRYLESFEKMISEKIAKFKEDAQESLHFHKQAASNLKEEPALASSVLQ